MFGNITPHIEVIMMVFICIAGVLLFKIIGDKND